MPLRGLGWPLRSLSQPLGCLSQPQGSLEGGGDGRTDVRTDVRTDGRTDGQIPPVFYRTSSPSGPLPKKEESKKVKGITERRKETRPDIRLP